ncbi:putative vesicle-associated membrane protein 726 [Tritrichomonas foetus]|uniref:Vesicle-associated membrane protein 726 n=1 Tax=Tritrichomonas foetus TaxID=1144522 RepID=A0A1J4J7R3_9EUKA|nr:putative vesicle-associated membrane protein 726 [Tritrichomonas foetus]|eukprot:OHS94705.1 putative vesicle-associated membrane protein 726 [Tritrichomonas foetus]
MTFVYATVLRDKTPLAEYPLGKPEFSSAAASILSQITIESPRFTAQQANYLFTTMFDTDGITYVCVSDKTLDARIRNTFINELQREWRLKYGSSCSSFAAHEKDAEFGAVIERVMNNYNDERTRKLNIIKENLTEAQNEMSKNMEVVFDRDSKLMVMSDKADEVADQSQLFYQGATDLRRKMCWQKYKNIVLIVVVVVIVLIVLIIAYSLKSSKKDDKDK